MLIVRVPRAGRFESGQVLTEAAIRGLSPQRGATWAGVFSPVSGAGAVVEHGVRPLSQKKNEIPPVNWVLLRLSASRKVLVCLTRNSSPAFV